MAVEVVTWAMAHSQEIYQAISALFMAAALIKIPKGTGVSRMSTLRTGEGGGDLQLLTSPSGTEFLLVPTASRSRVCLGDVGYELIDHDPQKADPNLELVNSVTEEKRVIKDVSTEPVKLPVLPDGCEVWYLGRIGTKVALKTVFDSIKRAGSRPAKS